MVEEARKGKVNTILVKDLSRLGRDYITVGDYMEQVFPLLGVRLIAVNNNYDSRENAVPSLDMEISNLVNTLYSRDLSSKIKSGKRAKLKDGNHKSNWVPYGYRKKAGSTVWEIDPEAAGVVRLIFDGALEGRSTSAIAAFLNERSIPTRMVYGQRKGLFSIREIPTAEHERLWNSTMVACVLECYEYTGALVGGKRESLAVGSGRIRKTDPSEWVIKEGDHEPIVSREEFGKAQMVIRSRKKADHGIPQQYALKGKVRCGNCHRMLVYAANTYEEYFYCVHGREQGEYSACCKDRYPMKTLERIVQRSLDELFARIIGLKEAIQTQDSTRRKEKDSAAIERRIGDLKKSKLNLYELYAEGMMDREEYTSRKGKMQEEISGLEAELTKTRRAEDREKERKAAIDKSAAAAKMYTGSRELTSRMVEQFIETVYVHGPERIEIVYKLENAVRLELSCK